MGIFDKLFGKKTPDIKLTDDQKHWLGLIDMRVSAVNFNLVKSTHTTYSYGESHFHEYKANEERVPKNEREEVAKSRVEGLLSIQDYIEAWGSEEQKFHYETSLIGAVLYRNSLEAQGKRGVSPSDLNKVKEIIYSHIDREVVLNEVEDYERKISAHVYKIRGLTRSKQEEAYSEFIDELMKIDILILHEIDLEKRENLFRKMLDILVCSREHLMQKINEFAYNQFEQGKLKKGLILAAQSILHSELEIFEDYTAQRAALAGFLDTFSFGLYLSGQYKDAVRISDVSISISPDHAKISEHFTNRGKSKLVLEDIEGAKLDFEKALEKDESNEEVRGLLEGINK